MILEGILDWPNDCPFERNVFWNDMRGNHVGGAFDVIFLSGIWFDLGKIISKDARRNGMASLWDKWNLTNISSFFFFIYRILLRGYINKTFQFPRFVPVEENNNYKLHLATSQINDKNQSIQRRKKNY